MVYIFNRKKERQAVDKVSSTAFTNMRIHARTNSLFLQCHWKKKQTNKQTRPSLNGFPRTPVPFLTISPFSFQVDSALASPTNPNTPNDSTPEPSNPLSLERKVDSILALLRSAESSTPTGRQQEYRGISPTGGEVRGEDLIQEGGEVGSDGDVEQARQWVGDAVDPSPEPEGTTRLRKMVIRIQVNLLP